jgi:hypothetical protein
MMASVLTVPSLIPINAGYYHARANYRAARALDAATWASTRDAGSTIESSAFHLAENLLHHRFQTKPSSGMLSSMPHALQ